MKAISLWQPWASAMAAGAKRNETRSWPTNYRGDLLICSAKRQPTRKELPDKELYFQAMQVPYGMALCVVQLYDCVPTSIFHAPTNRDITAEEMEAGDYTAGRYAWLTRNLRTFTRPFPVTGMQGLFDVSDAVIEAATLLPVKSMTLEELR